MAAPSAIVQQLRFEVSTTDAPLGRQLGDRLSQLFHNTLQQVLAEELARHAPAGPLLHLPRLVLELPPVPAHRFEQELPALLRAALRSALAGMPATAPATTEAASLAALRHFLMHGQLPWQATAGTFEPNRAIREALRLQPGGLRDLLRHLGGLRPPRQRLAGQLSLLTLGRLIDFLEPVHAPLIRAYLDETLAAHHRQPLVPATSTALQQIVYELVLADLLSTWHTQFNRRGFVERQLRQLAAHYNLGYEVLLRQLVSTLPVGVAGAALAPTLPGIIQTLYRQEREAAPSDLSADAMRRQPDATDRVNQPENADLTQFRKPTSSVSNAPQQAFSIQTPAAGRYTALRYFLRHESLPSAWNQTFSQTDLATELLAVLREGRPALLRLAQAVGPATMARTLLHHFPGLGWQELVQTLAPGQARPLLALAEEMARDKLLSVNKHLAIQQQFLHYLLTEANPQAGVPGLRRWLARQPALQPISGISARITERAITSWKSSTVTAEAEQRNLPLARRPSMSGNVDASQNFIEPTSLTHYAENTLQPTTIPQQLVDYLLLGLPAQRGAAAVSPAQLRRWLQSVLVLPAAKAELLALLQQHYRDQPVLRHLSALAGVRELIQLLPGRMDKYLKNNILSTLTSATASIKRQHLLREAYLLFHLRPHWEQTAPNLATGRELATAYHLPPQALHEALRRQLLAVPALAASRFFCWLLTSLARSVDSNKFGASTLLLSSPQYTVTPGTTANRFAPAPAAALGALRQTASSRLLRPLSPVSARLPSRQFRPTWPTQPAEARELVFSHLLRGTPTQHLSWLKPLGRWVAATQTGEFKTFLRRYAAIEALLLRLAELADFATLSHLTPSRRLDRRASLATLDALTAGPTGSAGLFRLLKMAWLAFYYRPDIAFSTATVRQLLAAQSLPLRATLTRLTQLGKNWPTLGAAPFFTRLLTRLYEASQPANSASGRRKLNSSAEPSSHSATSSFHEQQSAQPDTAVAQQDLLLYYLRHGQAPWWHTAPLPTEALGQTLRQLARQPRPLRELLRPHLHEAAVQRHLAQVADFSMLHELVPPPSLGRSQRQQLRPALAALDRRLRQSATGLGRFRLFLRQAYLAFAISSAPASGQTLAGARRLAGASGLSWRGVLLRVGSLVRQHPALAADPFFGALLQAFVALTRPVRPLKQPEPPRIAPPNSVAPSSPPASSMQGETAWQQLEHYLQTGAPAPGTPPGPALALLLQPDHTALLARLILYASQPAAQARLAAIVEPELFFRLLHQLFPVAYQLTSNIVRDWLQLQAAGIVQTGLAARTELWQAAIAVASAPDFPASPSAALVKKLLQTESDARPQPVTGPQLAQAIARQRLNLRSSLAALLVTLPAVAALAKPLAKPAEKATPSPRKPTPTTLRSKPLPPEPLAEAAYISNAGLVLLWPFFNMLFERVGYLEEKQFKNPEMAERAAHLLQFLVSGGAEFPEHLLLLNKLLCGIDPARPLARAVPLTPEERSTGEGLLGAALGRWESLKNTSIAGLRETFLQRPGKLVRGDERLTLTVETKTVDILLDRLPWSIALIKLPWMPLPLYVTWR